MAESRNTQDDQEVRAPRRSGGDVNADEVGTRTKVDMFIDEADQLCYGDATPVYSKDEADQLFDGKADKADTYTKGDVDGLLDDKSDKVDTYTKGDVDGLLDQFDQSNVVDQKITTAIDEATALEFATGVQLMRSYDLNVDRAGELIQQLRRRLAAQSVQIERLTAALLQLRGIVDAATGMNAFEYDEQGRLRPRPMPVEGE